MRLIVVCAFAAGCGVLTPDIRTSADRAHEVEPRCTGITDDSLARITAPTTITSVEPSYSYALGGPNGREARLRGAKLHLQPALAGTKGGLTRTLQCHQARVLLGKSQSPANDPYALPDEWLDIDVNSGDDGFVVEVAAAETDDAQLVLDRARQYSQQTL